jgi:NAD(P)-dependent dehydrogenase (short-subunit alcohol dehydrogenase family)
MHEFNGRSAFISGGASGIGLALAKVLLAEGMNVIIADIETNALAAAEAALAGAGSANRDRVLALELDVMDRAAYAAAADKAEQRFGNIHLVCNNAGVLGGPMQDADGPEWDWIIGVNVMGVINGALTFVPRLKAHGDGGHILNTASIAGVLPGNSVYNVSKSAAFAFSEGLHAMLANDNIGVSVLCPGLVDTNLFDAERNRPARYPRARPGPAVRTEQQRAEAWARMAPTMISAEDCAQRALQGIRNNELYIFTHPDLKVPVERRFARILAAMDGIPEPSYLS